MFYLVIFILELALLFFLSKKLIKSLSLLFYKVFKTQKAVVSALAILFLPGTIVHELAHLLTAGVLLVPVGEISVLPEIGEKEIKLGSVQIGKVDPFRLMIIGVAPVIIGLLSILGIVYFSQISQPLPWWQITLGLYLIFEISNTMFSSRKDLEGTIGFLVGLLVTFLICIGALYFLKPLILQTIWSYLHSLNWAQASDFFQKGTFYLLIPLIIDFIIVLITKPLRRF